MKNYFLDTSIIVDYLRGKEKAVNLVNNLDGNLTSSYVCLAELFEGVYRVREKENAKKIILEFFSSLAAIFGIDEQIAEIFGKIRAQLKSKGNVIEDLDILIAATCIINSLTLVTNNIGHFSRIKDLSVLAQ